MTQFQAQAYKELLPADGPVRTQSLGKPSRQKEEQAVRVKNFMNYQLMDVMKEYEPEFDQMLFYLPLAGSAFKKVYYDELLGRAVSKFVPADDLVVPYTATSIEDADSVMHTVKMSENDLRKKQVSGFYRDIELKPGYDQETEVEKRERQLEGIKKTRDEDIFLRLQDRTKFANVNEGDLFISIHTNAAEDRRASGFETFLIGPNKNEAAVRVAARENAALELEGSSGKKLTNEDLMEIDTRIQIFDYDICNAINLLN